MSGTSLVGKSLPVPVRQVAHASIGRECVVQAPSKLNIRLKVEGRREDGYHLLSMLNCSTSLQDSVRMTLTEEPEIHVGVKPEGSVSLGTGENLAARAFRAFWREFGWDEVPLGLRCEITKNIPVGGGLGGGSADAGAVLRHLEEVFGDSLSESFGFSRQEVHRRVLRAALSCGADVPYAVVGGLCWVGGIGEEVVPIRGRAVSPSTALIVVPPRPVPTGAFYERYRAVRPVVPALSDNIGRGFISGGLELLDLAENDFESTAEEMVSEIGDALRLMREVFPTGTALTGSGSVCFSLVPDSKKEEARELSNRLSSQGFTSTLSFLIFS
jgi:4-diphosphocytidyl-2-C-methyl-D-erythritol kinase